MAQFWMLWMVIAGSLAAGAFLACQGDARLREAMAAGPACAPRALVAAVAVGALLIVLASGRLFLAAVVGWRLYPFLAGQIAAGALLAEAGAGLGCAAARRRQPRVVRLGGVTSGVGVLLGGTCLGMAGAPFVVAALWALLHL
jgi:hypothetical protein